MVCPQSVPLKEAAEYYSFKSIQPYKNYLCNFAYENMPHMHIVLLMLSIYICMVEINNI